MTQRRVGDVMTAPIGRAAGASILIGAAAMLMRRTLRRSRASWYEPLPASPLQVTPPTERQREVDLAGRLAGGQISRAEYRVEIERLASGEAGSHPLFLPAGWEA